MDGKTGRGGEMMNHVTARDICKALSQRYYQPEYKLAFEVEGDYCRRADAVAMSMWPSRQNHIIGFEIKVSKRDLKCELECGAKAEACERHCNYWSLVVADGVIDDKMTIPQNWGIMVYKNDKLITVRKPTYKEAVITQFWTAMLLRAKWRKDDQEFAVAVEEAAREAVERARQGAIQQAKYLLSKTDRDYLEFIEAKEILRKEGVYPLITRERLVKSLKIADTMESVVGENGWLEQAKGDIKRLKSDLDLMVAQINAVTN
jgi:hypothetical protein